MDGYQVASRKGNITSYSGVYTRHSYEDEYTYEYDTCDHELYFLKLFKHSVEWGTN